MAKPTRTFSADVKQKSIGLAGPDQIEYDLDNAFAMFNPLATLRDGSSGGIGTENIGDGVITTSKLANSAVTPEKVATGLAQTLDTNAEFAQRAVNVKWYGAKGDGVTDDTTAIQNALSAAAGQVLYVPKGTYPISSSLLVDSNTMIRGAGKESVIKVTADNVHGFLVSGKSRVTIQDLKIVFAVTTPTIGNGVFIYNGSSDVLIERVHVVNASQDGIRITSSSCVTVKGCDLENSGLAGAYRGVQVFDNAEYITIQGNKVHGSTDFGICVQINTSGNPTKISIANNMLFSNAGGYDITILSTGTDLVLVMGNICASGTSYGINAHFGKSQVIGNICYNSGININETDDCLVADNVVYNAPSYAIFLEEPCKRCLVVNNRIRGAAYGGIIARGTDNVVRGNLITGIGNKLGILAEYPGGTCERTLVADNFIYNGYIQLGSSPDSRPTNNSVVQGNFLYADVTTGKAINVSLGSNNRVVDNTITGSYTNPIADTGTGTVIVTPSIVPAARVYRSVAQSIPHATLTALAFDSERFDTDSIHDPATNNSRLTCKTAGVYLITGNVLFVSNATGYREIYIRHSNGTFIAGANSPAVSGVSTKMHVSTLYALSAGDYVELCVYQNSGGALDVSSTTNYTPEFMMVRVG